MVRVVRGMSIDLHSSIFSNVAMVNCSSFFVRWPLYWLCQHPWSQETCEGICFSPVKIKVTYDYSCHVWKKQFFKISDQVTVGTTIWRIYNYQLIWMTWDCFIHYWDKLILISWNLMQLRELPCRQGKYATTFASTIRCMIKSPETKTQSLESNDILH